jgi:hypothetical protein
VTAPTSYKTSHSASSAVTEFRAIIFFFGSDLDVSAGDITRRLGLPVDDVVFVAGELKFWSYSQCPDLWALVARGASQTVQS